MFFILFFMWYKSYIVFKFLDVILFKLFINIFVWKQKIKINFLTNEALNFQFFNNFFFLIMIYFFSVGVEGQ